MLRSFRIAAPDTSDMAFVKNLAAAALAPGVGDLCLCIPKKVGRSEMYRPAAVVFAVDSERYHSVPPNKYLNMYI